MMLKNIPFAKARPDGGQWVDQLMGRAKGKPRLVEYLVDEVIMRPVVSEMLGRTWAPEAGGRENEQAYLDNFIEFWYRLGYDFVRYERGMGFTSRTLLAPDTAPDSHKDRAWADEHQGVIRSWEDYERYPWPRIEKVDFFGYEYINRHLPEGMGFVVSHAAGVLEHLTNLMSYEGLSLALHDAPDLVQAISEKVGGLFVEFYKHLLTLDRVVAIFPGDDMGFRTATLVAPAHLRQYVLPWHKRFAELAHAAGKPYFLHSCGNLVRIMDDLIEDVKIDGKHSYEDAILPVEEFQKRYGERIAVLGGLDVHRLTTGTPEEVRRHTRYLIETCGSRGRYAIGSGNSIPSYIPAANYLAMVDEAHY